MSEILATEQKLAVAGWIGEGLSLSEVQRRINSEFKISITYMDLRFLVDDLNLTLQDKTSSAPQPPPAAPAPSGNMGGVEDMLLEDEPGAAGDVSTGNNDGEDAYKEDLAADQVPGGGVKITVDAIQRPGEIASGSVTFSDGKSGQWFIDGYRRLGFEPPYKGYQPTQQDVIQFQSMLEKELSKGGY
ncbi:MAG: hypothetical protein LBG65_02455 [Puniceicoccales bacterium]|jgi:hypothetical protein|nr:hypothetical protein [Puniceicoccales bacterium]